MEDLEYSVEISDRDWDCFFQECEECNLLPPSLAGLEDSGMSDIDDTGAILAKRAQKVDLTAGLSEADHPIDEPPDSEGSPVEHFLSQHGGMESILSGSEEDIHLQSVNIFFERLKNVTEAERLPELSQVKAGKERDAIQEEELRSDGKQASSSSLPKSITKLNSSPARDETASGKETMEPVDTISSVNTMKIVQPGYTFLHEPAPCNPVLNINISAPPEIELFIREEACTKTRANGESSQNQSHDSPDRSACSESPPQAEKVIKVKMCTPSDDKQEDLSASQCNTDSQCNLEVVTNVKWKEDQNLKCLHPDTACTNKVVSQEWSPSASVKRKRRKKKRLSNDPAENGHGYDRQFLVKRSDSDEEQYAWRGGRPLSLSEDINLFNFNEPQKTSHSVTGIFPVMVFRDELKLNFPHSLSYDSQYQHVPDIKFTQGWCKAPSLTENKAINDISVTQTDDCVTSALNNNANVVTNSQLCSKLQVEEPAGLNIYSGRPVSLSEGVTGKSDLATEAGNDESKYVNAGNLQQPDKKSHNSIMSCENEQNLKCCTPEAELITHSILPSADSNDPAVGVIQNYKLSTAKLVLAAEAGNSGRDNYNLRLSEAAPQQQLEIERHHKDQYSPTLEKTHLSLSATGEISSDVLKLPAHNTKSQIPTQAACAILTSDCINVLPDNGCLSESPSNSTINTSVQEAEHPQETSSKLDVLPEKDNMEKEMFVHNGDPCSSGEMNLTGNSKRETNPRLSMSEDLITTTSDITSVSSCCTLDTESVMSLSNGNITDTLVRSCSSVNQNESEGQGEKTSLILATNKGGDATCEPNGQLMSHDTNKSKCDLIVRAEDAITASKAECETINAPDSKHSVFAMSSFWSEMEKLTINDIMGLRMMSRTAPASSLTPLEESEENDMLAVTDSGFFTQQDKSKTEQSSEDVFSDSNSAELNSGFASALDSTHSGGVKWESEPVPVSHCADIYPETMMLTSVSDVPQPVLSGSAQKYLGKISKNVSVHNLTALESGSRSCAWKGQTLQTLNERESAKVEYFIDGDMPNQEKATDCLPSSSTASYRRSLTDIFQYIFGKKQPIPSQLAADNVTNPYTDGSSVPETYDHFFSEFDTETFFCPLITAEEKDESVPIYTCSSPTNKNLQFPEAYDYFFGSSSTDDSSVESDEESDESHRPVRVVTRFTRKASSNQLCQDIYDNFFTDSDLKQNFFWKNTFSFRNINFTGSTVQRQTSSPLSLVSVRQSDRTLRRTIHPLDALGNQDVRFPDPLLYHLEDRISRQLAQQPFRHVDRQLVSNPRLDASLLPLRQSDMCLVCIAFASWVLKTANPQVGDAWKAVLLANVSALSAIRYLRKYVKVEATSNERKLHHTAPSDSDVFASESDTTEMINFPTNT
ncbi:PGC-1 and ERR-induced regulator in muscle protein 1 isoform X1 [Scomber scombrus]|uniref:PGC-1 and ERR-induced regulator in muscle protein 1 isoform X1 n=1 Tax=Scomber scombrus TaxID=13677 RepID=A0AAV1MVY7_SCOSC